MDLERIIGSAIARCAVDIATAECALAAVDARIGAIDAQLAEIRATARAAGSDFDRGAASPAPTPRASKLLTVSEAAAAVGMDRKSLYALIARGGGPAVVKVGKRQLRVHPAALDAWSRGTNGGRRK